MSYITAWKETLTSKTSDMKLICMFMTVISIAIFFQTEVSGSTLKLCIEIYMSHTIIKLHFCYGLTAV